MAAHVFQRSIQDEAGNVMPGASVEVRDQVTSGLIQLYSNYAGTTPIGNPITADGDGFVRFYAGAGRYRIVATSGAQTRIWEDEVLGQDSDLIEIRRTAAEIAAGVTPVNYQYEPGYVLRYGTNTSPGVTNMASAVQAAANQAIQVGGTGCVYFPPGRIAIGTGIVCNRAVLFKGVGGSSGGTGNETKPFTVVLKQFTGDLFTFNGIDGTASPVGGSGGGVQDMRLVNDSGTAITANGGGNAIVITGTSTTQRASWVRICNVIIEYAAARDSWTWAIVIDGTGIAGSVIPDITITDISTHTASSNGGSLKFLAANVQVSDSTLFDAAAGIVISGISGTPSSGVYFDNVLCAGGVALDYANNVAWDAGVISGNLTNTANTGGLCDFRPSRYTGAAFTNNASGAFFFMHYSTSAYAAVTGGLRLHQAIILKNAQHLHGLIAAGTNAPSLIGMDSSDNVHIAANGSDIRLGRALVGLGGGAAPTLGTIGGAGPATATQNTWAKFIDSTGAAFYVPVWK